MKKASGLSRGLTVLAVLLWPLGVSAIPVAPYLPLVDGNAWTYQVNGGASANQTSTVQSGTVNVNGVPTKRIYSSSTGETDNYTNDANGVRFHGAFLPSVNFGSPCLLQAETQTFSPPFVFAPADIPSFPNSTGTQSGSVSIALPRYPVARLVPSPALPTVAARP